MRLAIHRKWEDVKINILENSADNNVINQKTKIVESGKFRF